MAITFNDDQAATLLELLCLPPYTTDTDTVLATFKTTSTRWQAL